MSPCISSTARTSSTRAGFAHRDELVDDLASFVAVRGARGVVVFDGVGEDREIGALGVRFAPHADSVLERLAAEARARETVLLVTSDAAVRGTSGQEVRKRGSAAFLSELAAFPIARTRRAGSPTASIRRPVRGSSAFAAVRTESGRFPAVCRPLDLRGQSCHVRLGDDVGHRPPPHASSVTPNHAPCRVDFSVDFVST